MIFLVVVRDRDFMVIPVGGLTSSSIGRTGTSTSMGVSVSSSLVVLRPDIVLVSMFVVTAKYSPAN